MKQFLLLLVISCIFNIAMATDLYWVGNGGDWNNVTHWSQTSGGSSCNCIPTQNDNVFFDANSFGSGGQTVTINQEAYCKSMNWTGAVSSSTLAGGYSLNIYGSLTLNSLMNITYTGYINFKSNNSGNTIKTFGKTLTSQLTFDGLGGEWILQDNLTLANGNSIFHNTGSLNTNNAAVSVYIFRSSGAGIRSLTLGSSTITVSYNSGSSAWDISGSNLTMNSGTSTIILTGANAAEFRGSNFTYYNVTFTGNGSISGDHTFNNLTLGTSKTTGNNGIQTINGTFTCNGTAAIYASLTGGTLKKSSGIVCINYVNLTNSIATGGASFYAGNSQNLGNNVGWLFQSCSAPNLILLLSPGNSNPPGYTISTLNPAFIWNAVPSATLYGLQLYKKNNSVYDPVFNSDNINNTSVVLPAGTIANASQYYWQVRAKVNNSWTSYSSPFYFTVSIASITPILALSSSSIQTGGSISFTGSNFTINNQAKIIITSNNGYDTILTVNTDNIGHFNRSITFSSSGSYNVYCKDLSTSNITSSKSFQVLNPASYFNILLPYSGYQANVNENVIVKWKDKLEIGSVYPIVGSQRGYKYFVEISSNSGTIWQKIDTIAGYDVINIERTFNSNVIISQPSSNYLIRVKDGYLTTRITTSVPIQILATTSSVLTADFIWDNSSLASTAPPVGVVNDGVSRFYIKILDPGNTISQVTVTLLDADNNNEPRTLGKLMEATNITTYDPEANNANQISIPLTHPHANNEFWCWYVAPDDFIGSNPLTGNLESREVKVKIRAEYNSGPYKEIIRKITIIRPPLVLVHGLNGDLSTWDSYIGNEQLHNFDVHPISIGKQAGFAENASKILYPFLPIMGPDYSIPSVVTYYRINKRIACSQVYYVGHSMGGNTLRYAETYYPNNFKTQKNYYKGWINKFISLDTPHKGSPFANLLNISLPVVSVVDKLFIHVPLFNNYYKRGLLDVITDVHPAIRDLRMNSFNFNSSSYKSHVFIGDIVEGPETFSNVPSSTILNLNLFPDLYKIVKLLYYYNPLPDYMLWGALNTYYSLMSDNSITNSDFIVPLNSQLSDLSQNDNKATYTVNFHSKGTGSPSIEMNSAERVANLLDTTIFATSWGYLPALQKQNLKMYNQNVCKNIFLDSTGIEILSPKGNDSLYIDSLFSLAFTLTDTTNLKKIEIRYQDKIIEDTLNQSNYNYSLSVSNNFIDTQKVFVTAFYSANDSVVIKSKYISIFIKPNQVPSAIKSKEEFTYLPKGEDYYPDVNLIYPTFIGKIGTVGTGLNVNIGNSEILSYDQATKKITAIKDGETFAALDYNGLKDTIYFKTYGDNLVGIEDDNNHSNQVNPPKGYELYQNYPNPFNPETRIKYSIPATSNVKILIYNSLGQLIKELVNKVQEANFYELEFNANKFASGVYFYTLNATSVDGKQNYRITKKMILLK